MTVTSTSTCTIERLLFFVFLLEHIKLKAIAFFNHLDITSHLQIFGVLQV